MFLLLSFFFLETKEWFWKLFSNAKELHHLIQMLKCFANKA